MKVIFTHADKEQSISYGDEVVFCNGSLYVDGIQTVVFATDKADATDVIGFKVEADD